MNESEFVTAMYPQCRRLAERISTVFTQRRVPIADLTQVGALACLLLYRKHGQAPQRAVASRAAWCNMLDTVRLEMGRFEPNRRVRRPFSIDALPDDYDEPKRRHWLSDDGGTADRIRERIQLDQALSHLTPGDERELFDRTLAGETNQQIGERFGVHRSRIGQRRSAAIQRIRMTLGLSEIK